MSTRPPRRRREPAHDSHNVRTVLLGIIVVVAGLGIGMLSAVVMHHGSNNTPVPVAPQVTPIAAPPAAGPLRTPFPLATVARPIAAKTPLPTLAPTPSAIPSLAPTPSAVPSLAPTPRATAHPTPARAPTQIPTQAPATPVAISTGFDVDIAQAVVRRYLDAIARGDNATARALLGASPADVTVPLPELAFINTNSKIGAIVGRRTGDASAAVEVQVTNGTQKYGIVYEVVQGPKGTLISGRDITRP
ncbi:MAG TPA: hypothetical protein VN905_04360 [Candidatus Binatia bacterium]|nr:hypothetical protein [Candidatus Binatia bacterium]